MPAATAQPLAETRARLVERVAALAALEVPPAQIAATVGIARDQVVVLLEAEDTQQAIARLREERFEAQQRLNVGWDAVEEDGVAQVLEYMHASKDPEFALRAARAANAAVRRGPAGSQPAAIQGGITQTAVINLTAMFVEKLQSMRVGIRELDREAHRVDALPLAKAERLLQTDTAVALSEIFKGVEID